MSKGIENILKGSGQLAAFPAKRKMKMPALRYLAEKFEPGRVYSEREVNELLNRWHTFEDPATLRRELFNGCFLGRQPDGRSYWREEVLPEAEL